MVQKRKKNIENDETIVIFGFYDLYKHAIRHLISKVGSIVPPRGKNISVRYQGAEI